jgi:deoxyribonuclease IV
MRRTEARREPGTRLTGRFGAHVSIAGGFDEALRRGRDLGCAVVQVFTANARGWAATDVTDEAVRRLEAARRETGLSRIVAHAGYLINLAAPDHAIWRKSVDAMAGELRRAERIGASDLVVHPGAHLGTGEAAGVARIVRALDEALRRAGPGRCRVALETTAGSGTVLGGRFEHLRGILDGVREPRRLSVCFDTCHVFAAGYDLRTPAAVRETLAEFDRVIGLDRLALFHFNDAKQGLGSRVDRHEHLGRGEIGLGGFRVLVSDRRLLDRPMILETPKGGRGGTEWDRRNLGILKKIEGNGRA